MLVLIAATAGLASVIAALLVAHAARQLLTSARELADVVAANNNRLQGLVEDARRIDGMLRKQDELIESLYERWSWPNESFSPMPAPPEEPTPTPIHRISRRRKR